ncbi:hypothetical protein [Streptomyces sp. NPDC055134]
MPRSGVRCSGESTTYSDDMASGVLDPDACAVLARPVRLAPFAQRLEIWPATPASAQGGGDEAELMAWVRWKRPSAPSVTAVVFLADALPPAPSAMWSRMRPMPTVEVSVHITEALDHGPVGGDGAWALVRMSTAFAGTGWTVDDCAIWDVDGRLPALARQTRSVREAAGA